MYVSVVYISEEGAQVMERDMMLHNRKDVYII